MPDTARAVYQTKKVCDVLVGEGILLPEQYETVLQMVQRTGERPEEVILDLAYLAEGDMLKALATFYKTRFVTTEKLARVDVEKPILDLIPRRLAENACVFPVMFDAAAKSISVVTPDPDDPDIVAQVQMGSGAKTVTTIVARPAAVRAAIAKAYQGDIHAFALLDRQAQEQLQSLMNNYDRNLVSDSSMAVALAKENSRPERVITEQQLMKAGSRGSSSGNAKEPTSTVAFIELLNVLVSLIENGRGDLRGHSAEVARLTRRIVERLAVPPPTDSAIVASAYLHDLGKGGQFHLTALNVGEYEGHKAAAVRVAATPARLVESVGLAEETLEAVSHMYERFDGTGFPDGLSGKEIPLGSRLLAITDTYADLTQNARNPYRKALTREDACSVLEKHKGTIFDPHLTDLFRHVVIGDDIKARLLANRYVALLVDTDPEETTVLELRMIEQGFVVKMARSADQAVKVLADEGVDLVISELELPGRDGLALLKEARGTTWGKTLPWVIYTRRQGRKEAERAFAEGVLDFVSKPAPTDVLVAKMKALLDQRATTTTSAARGVSGSLEEMGLPDIIQVLWHGRKSGNLRIRGSGGEAGEIHVMDGSVVNALWGTLRGAEAFYAMLKVTSGEFGLDPAFKPTARIMNESSEALLLEGMRRMDEGIGG